MSNFETIAAQVCHQISDSPIKGRRVVISLGPTRSYADDMRYLSNRSSGAMGLAIADEFYRKGADVFTICGAIQKVVPSYFHPIMVETNIEMKEAWEKLARTEKPEIGIFSAAALDFDVTKPASGKHTSAEAWLLELVPSKKILDTVHVPGMMSVAFKLESQISVEDLKARVQKWLSKHPVDIVVANRLEDISEDQHHAHLYRAFTSCWLEAKTKKEVAQALLNLVVART